MISELKVTIQRQDSQLKQAHTQLDSRHSDYSSISVIKDELLKENQRLLTKLQSCEEREKRKVPKTLYVCCFLRHCLQSRILLS